jgi:hypothetical protein
MSKAQRWMHIHGDIVMGLQVGRIVLNNHSYDVVRISPLNS